MSAPGDTGEEHRENSAVTRKGAIFRMSDSRHGKSVRNRSWHSEPAGTCAGVSKGALAFVGVTTGQARGSV